MPAIPHFISFEFISISKAYEVVFQNQLIQLSPTIIPKIINCHRYLQQKISQSDQAFYGINTGFGSMCNIIIPKDQITILQQNLLLSHACGTGDLVPIPIIRLMLLLKIQSLSYGHSGVQLQTIERLIQLFNEQITPVIYQQGSLGASGDLAPLAHLALPLLGLGEVYDQEQRLPTAMLFTKKEWQPLTLQAKEGLALINGTQFMAAYGVWCVQKAQQLIHFSNLIAALALDAFDARPEPFWALTHQIRGQKGQQKIAQGVRAILQNSAILAQPKKQVQDPYSFRCIPQVHGASWDTIQYVSEIIGREINAVTDNPNIFPEEDLILSGGNFHGQPLALALDYLAIALSELGSISERRTFKLLGGERDLPINLTANPGVHSGLMMAQYTAASIASQNKQLCTPASVDSITSSKGQEDHVSMGANAATKCYRVVHNLERILAIELLVAAQALDWRKKKFPHLRSSDQIEEFMVNYRRVVSFNEADRILHEDISQTILFMKNNSSHVSVKLKIENKN